MRLRRLILLPLWLAALPAMADELTFTHPSGASAEFYGHLNLTFQNVADGARHRAHVVDNSNSESRLGLRIDLPTGDTELRFVLETALGLRGTADTSQNGDTDRIDWQRTDLRRFEGVVSGGFGSVWLGQGGMATDGAAEVDKSGTSVVGTVDIADTAGSFRFRDGDALSDIAVGDVFDDFDGSRRFRLRYDTPEQHGFTLSAAYGREILAAGDDADYYDLALRYAFENDAVGFDAALGYAWTDDDGRSERVVASGSLSHDPTGLTLTLAAGSDRSGDAGYGYAKLGWRGDLVAFGETALSVDYYDGSGFERPGSRSTALGLQAVQTVEALSLEAYIGFRELSFDADAGAAHRDIRAILVGARWSF